MSSIFSTTIDFTSMAGTAVNFASMPATPWKKSFALILPTGFTWVGITEHMPPVNDGFLFPDEREAGLTAEAMMLRFDRYMTTCRHFQEKYASQIEILVGV